MTAVSKLPQLWLAVFIFISLLPSSFQIEFTQPQISHNALSVPEDMAIGHMLVNITDNAAGSPNEIQTVTYLGSDGVFKVVPVPGQQTWTVELNAALDYESQARYRPVFQASGGPGVEATIIRFTLYVDDVNDNPPQFENQPYNAHICEDASIGTTVYTNIEAHDKDTGPGGSFFYQLLSGRSGNGGKFIINSATGVVILNGSLDYESTTFYLYSIIAKDRGCPSLNSTTNLFITVNDVQDSPPVFTNSHYIGSVPENTLQYHSVLTVRAVDQDRAIPNAVSYSILHSSCPQLFQVDTTSGVLYVAGFLDRDSGILKDQTGLCTITLKATEQDGEHVQKGNFTATATATISVTDVNDNAPYFSNTAFSANIAENSPPGTPLLLGSGQQIIVTDIDQGSNSKFSLSLSSDCLRVSPISSWGETTIVISVANSSCFDYETSQSLDFKVFANGTLLSNYTSVSLHIQNVDDNEPHFSPSTYRATIPENTSIASFVTVVHANDKDIDDFNVITYSLQGGDQMFAINKQTGEVTVAKDGLDYEYRKQYQLTVEATDNGNLQATATLIIDVTDVNDEAPQFDRRAYQVFLKENGLQLENEVTVKAIDYDQSGTPNSAVVYHLQDSQWSRKFNMSADGTLSVVSPVDFEKLSNGRINLTIVATDSGEPPLNSSVQVVVIVQDENDCRHVFSKTPLQEKVTEGSTLETDILTVNATDGDGIAPNTDVFYVIASGGNDHLKINSMTGQITTTADIHREVQTSYSLVVEAVDNGSPAQTGSATILIDVLDINDDPPRFSPKEISVYVEEETPPGIVAYNFTAVNNDEKSDLTYAVLGNISTGGDENFKIVNTATLQIQPVALYRTHTLAIETANLNIVVQDIKIVGLSGSIQTATGTISVQVRDIDDNAPYIAAGNFNASFDENSPDGTSIQIKTIICASNRGKVSSHHDELR